MTTIGWTPSDDDRWEAAERADHAAGQRQDAMERASMGNLPRGWSKLDAPPPGTCWACRGHRVVWNVGGFQRAAWPVGSMRPCPECAIVPPTGEGVANG